MKNLDFARDSRISFIQSIDAPSAAKQFAIDCAYTLFSLAAATVIIYVGS